MHFAYISLGSNQGNRKAYLSKAKKELAKLGKITQISTILETKAWGKTDQPDFLNQALLLETNLSPLELLQNFQKIENNCQRERKEKWGPRTLDLDLLFFDDLILNTPELKIPHPLLHKRIFVLEPLAEIAADFKHPVLDKNIQTLLQKLKLKL